MEMDVFILKRKFPKGLSGNKIAIKVMGVRPVDLLGTANEAMGVSFLILNFLKGLLMYAK